MIQVNEGEYLRLVEELNEEFYKVDEDGRFDDEGSPFTYGSNGISEWIDFLGNQIFFDDDLCYDPVDNEDHIGKTWCQLVLEIIRERIITMYQICGNTSVIIGEMIGLGK